MALLSEEDLRSKGFVRFSELSEEAKEIVQAKFERNPFTKEIILNHSGPIPWFNDHWFSQDGKIYIGRI